ncbi:MAG: hypothetical protein AAF614_03520 [Chloroflexota bacterium]
MQQKLSTLIEQVAGFALVRCCMRHEKIRREPGGINPLQNAAVEHGLLRGAYCSSQIRAKRLACAHTLARTRLLQMLDEIPAEACLLEQVLVWKEKIYQLDLAIIDVDWRKSDAELAHAQQSVVVVHHGDDAPEAMKELEAIERTIKRLDQEHTVYVERLLTLQTQILGTLQAALENSS